VTCNPDAEIERGLAAFPAPLRALIEAELAAGNAVTEIGGGFPAPPCGAWARLARPVSTRQRQSAGGLVFRTRNWHAHSFEWGDEEGYFLVLEPPLPTPRQPSMDEIRAARSTGAGIPLPAPPKPRLLAAGEYCVEVDYRGEMVTYREADRIADVTCTWGPHPIIARNSLTGWRSLFGGAAMLMSADERQTALDRIVTHLQRLDLGNVELTE